MHEKFEEVAEALHVDQKVFIIVDGEWGCGISIILAELTSEMVYWCC